MKTILILMSLVVVSYGQSGGSFSLTQSVIAGGGGQSTGGTFTATGTAGQPAASTSTGGTFSLASGFWNAGPLGTTAAEVGIGGRVLTPNGAGLRNATVVFTDQAGHTQSVRSNAFGYYRIDGLRSGGSYLISVESKRYTFAPRVVMLTDELTDFNLTAQP